MHKNIKKMGSDPAQTNYPDHQAADVKPWEWAEKLDGEGAIGPSMKKYLELRPPNNGNHCEENIVP